MAMRVRKSFKIAPGVKLNLNKKSVGISIGGKYGRVSTNTSGRVTKSVSIPGSGISYVSTSGSVGRTRSRGTPITQEPLQWPEDESVGVKNKWSVFFLCLFFGFLGVHRFYVGKVGSGMLYLCTCGLLFCGWVVDLFLILTDHFFDINNRPLQK